MATVRRQTSKKRRSKFLGMFFREELREGVCSECGRPFLDHPNRAPTFRFSRGNVEVFVYQGRRLLQKVFLLRVGVWRLGADEFQLGQMFAEQDFEDLQQLLTEAVEFVKGCGKVFPKSTPAEMRSLGSVTENEKEDYGTK